MSRHDNRYNGDGEADQSGSSPYDVFEDRSSHHQKQKYNEPERDRLRTRERDQDRDTGRDRRHSDYHDRSGRDGRGRGRNEDNGRSRNHDYSRRYDYDRDKERHHRHRSRSPSVERSRDKSRSRSKSKRTSGFDMAPTVATTLPGAPGQQPEVPQAMPGMFQSMFPFGKAQMGAVPMMPAQAMTQQATRHARRVYVGGLPPLANEQTIATYFSHIMTYVTQTRVRSVGHDTYPSVRHERSENWGHGDTVLFLDTGTGTHHDILINKYGK